MVEVLAKPATNYLSGKISICRSDHPYIDTDATVAPDPFERLLLENPEYFALRLKRHVGDFVNEQSSAMRTLESSSSSIFSEFSAKELNLHTFGSHAGRVDNHERVARAARPSV